MGLDNPIHIAFLVVILLLVFGAKRLPEIGRSLGSGMREFKDSISGEAKQAATLNAAQQPQPPLRRPSQPAAAATQTPAESPDESTFAEPAVGRRPTSAPTRTHVGVPGSTEGRPSSSRGEPQRQQ